MSAPPKFWILSENRAALIPAFFVRFPQAEALKAISLARYLAACDRKTLPGIETWQLNHQIPYLEPLTERVYGTLF